MADPIRLVPSAGAEPQELPQNIEAEAALLGAMMIDNRVAEDVMQKLRSDHFFEPIHARIYDAILALVGRNMVANPVTLRPMFEADEAMKELGGPAYLARLTGSGAALIGARDFAEQIYELAMLRALVSVGREMVASALDTSEEVNPRKQIEDAEVALYTVSESGGEVGSVKSFLQASTEAVRLVDRAKNAGGGLSGITTGFSDLNAAMGGLQKSDLLILAGRPGMGKTSLATNIAFNAAQRWARDKLDGIEPDKSVGAAVAFFSLEMSADQLAMRILAEASGISSEKLRKGEIDQRRFNDFARAAGELQDLKLLIDDTPALTIAALRTRARRLQRRHEIGLVVVDYLQLLQGSGRGSNDNRVNEISEISRGLKTLAKELNVPVIALSQLSRAVESREDKRPQLSDLRESGSIEQDADIVMFVYREDYYHNFKRPPEPTELSSADEMAKYDAWMAEEQKIVGKAQVIIAKQRHGATGVVTLRFQPEITKFSDLADEGRMPTRY